MDSHTDDLQGEQAHIDLAYSRLDAMRAVARDMLASVIAQGRGGTHQAREEREVIVNASLQRLGRLDIGDQSLCFGRIDRAPSEPGDSATGETFYIGRLGVYGEDQEPLVVDWRAPVAEPFYRATGRDPMGLARRRHFAAEGRLLVDIEDELFAVSRRRAGGEGAPGPGEEAGAVQELVGPGALLAALERSRSAHMRDIAATVQREQDEIIRAPLQGVLVVQGGPGTGKTAVALHRAAYLLYTYRFPLERQGVLVVGPNQVFLRYIERVLPSLGESGVVLSTIEGLAGEPRARSAESPMTAALKGDPRMATVLAKAVRDRERALRVAVEVPFGSTVLRISEADSLAAVRAGRRRPGTHNSKRRQVESVVLRRLRGQYLDALRRGGAGGDVELEELSSRLLRTPAVAEALERMWPRLTAEELVHDLYGSAPLLRLAGRGLLSSGEVEALHRSRSSSLGEIPWSAADLALLDEARELLGPLRRRAVEEGPRSYGHIVVDEAQDLSPMQLRMLARRSISGSMTVVGDLAQATGTRAPEGWGEVTDHLPRGRPPRVAELSVNYRTPSEVMALAGRVLEVTAPQLSLPRSVRSSGEEPVFTRSTAPDLAADAARHAAAELSGVPGGTVAVITPSAIEAEVGTALAAEGVPVSEAGDRGVGSAVTLVAIPLVKGLEFDSVVVVEPTLIVEEAGLRALFVALSRPTRRLTVVYTVDLPGPIAASPSAGRSLAGSPSLGAR